MLRIVLALLVLSGCATALARSPTPEGSPAEIVVESLAVGYAIAGETMDFDVRLHAVTLGHLQLGVGEPGDYEGRHSVIVKSRGGSTGLASMIGDLSWEMTTTIDVETGYVVVEHEQQSSQLAGKHEQRETHRGWEHESMHHNVLSAVGALRGWRSQPGARARIDLFVEYLMFRLEVEDAGREIIGTTPAVRYAGVIDDEHGITIWISDDTARVPLRMRAVTELGDVEAELVHYEAPRDQ